MPRIRGIRLLICAGDWNSAETKLRTVVEVLEAYRPELLQAMKQRGDLIVVRDARPDRYYDRVLRSICFRRRYFDAASIELLATLMVELATGAYFQRVDESRPSAAVAGMHDAMRTAAIALLHELPENAETRRLLNHYQSVPTGAV